MTVKASLVAGATSLCVLLAVTFLVVQHIWIDGVDLAVRHFAVTHQVPVLVSLSRAVVRLGSVPVAVAGLALACGVASWRTRSVRPVLAALLTMSFAAIATGFTKEAVGRASASFAALPATGTDGQSYPSGHAVLAAAAWGLAALLVTPPPARGRLVAVSAAAVVATGVGVGMAYGPGHWLSDVVAGWALGVTSVSLSALLMTRFHPLAAPSTEQK